MSLADYYCQLQSLSLLSADQVQNALNQVSWPGRMEILSKNPLILIDGAHNPHAIHRLVDNLNQRYPNQHKQILFTCINTKEERTMIRQLKKVKNATLTLTSFTDHRAITKKNMQKLAEAEQLTYCDWQAFLKKAKTFKDMVVVTGSLYFLAQVRPTLCKQEIL